MLDEYLKEVGKLAVPIFSGVVLATDALGKIAFPDLTDEERAKFNGEVIQDMENSRYELYVDRSYPINVIAYSFSVCIIARKP